MSITIPQLTILDSVDRLTTHHPHGTTLYFGMCAQGSVHFVQSGATLHPSQILPATLLTRVAGKNDTYAYNPS